LGQLPNQEVREPETDTKNIYTSENCKKKFKWVEPVFEPVQEILAKLTAEEVSEPGTDTRSICTSENYKKAVKQV
jgi:hypothetical protein